MICIMLLGMRPRSQKHGAAMAPSMARPRKLVPGSPSISELHLHSHSRWYSVSGATPHLGQRLSESRPQSLSRCLGQLPPATKLRRA